MQKRNEALRILEGILKDLEKPKNSVSSSVQKLMHAADLCGNEDIKIWCKIQLDDKRYTAKLRELAGILKNSEKVDEDSEDFDEIAKEYTEKEKECNDIGLKNTIHFSNIELPIKAQASSGGYNSIGFIEDQYADLIRTKKGNDGTYYRNPLSTHIEYIKNKTYEYTTELFNAIKFHGTISNCFDILKEAVDDTLLDISPELAEQLMLSFKSVSSENEEEWSQALTTCRRLLESLANEIYPAREGKVNGRSLGPGQYINRLWAFMDERIESESNKELAKAHIDFLGTWLQKTYRLTNKGVHAKTDKIEAVKTVFHVYLIISDILGFLPQKDSRERIIDINTATLDEIESLLDIPRKTAKEIVKARINHNPISLKEISEIKGIGKQTMSKIKAVFNL
ncbi:TPA: ComEA family DNA-binding protein [Serratia fonticola]